MSDGQLLIDIDANISSLETGLERGNADLNKWEGEVSQAQSKVAGFNSTVEQSGGHLGHMNASVEEGGQSLSHFGQHASEAKEKNESFLAGIGEGVGKIGVFSLALGGTFEAGKAFVDFLGDAVKAGEAEQAINARLGQSLRDNVPAYQQNTAAVEEAMHANEKFAYDDEVLKESFQSLVTHTHDVGEAMKLQATAMDFARGRNLDLQTATNVLGRVYEGHIAVLGRYGVYVEKGATATEALAAVQARFAAQSQTYANTTSGAVDKLKIAFDDTVKTIGTALLPIIATLATGLADFIPKIMGVVSAIFDFLKPAFEIIGTLLNAIGTGIDWVGQHLGLWQDKTVEATGTSNEAWKGAADSFSSSSQNIASSLDNTQQRFVDGVGIIGDAGTESADAYGSNMTDGIDGYQGDISNAAGDLVNAADMQEPAGQLGYRVGSVYAIGSPGGMTAAFSDNEIAVNSAALSLVMSADQTPAAAQIGMNMGNALATNFAGTAQDGVNHVMSQARAAMNTLKTVLSDVGFVGYKGADWKGYFSNLPLGGGGGGGGLPPGLTVKEPPPYLGTSRPPPGFQGVWGIDQATGPQDPIHTIAGDAAAAKKAGKGAGGGGGGSGGGSGKSAVDSAIQAAADMTSKISDAVQKGIAALGQLSNFVLPQGFTNGVEQFAQGVNVVMMKMQDVALHFQDKMLLHSGVFLDTAGKAMDLVSKGVAALTALKDFKAPTDASMTAFSDAVEAMLTKLGAVAAKWKVDALAHTSAFADTAGKVMDMVSKAVDALTKLRDFRKPSDEAMQSFVDAVDYLTDKFRRVVAKWDSASLASAAAFGEGVGKFLSGIGSAIDMLTKLTTFRKPSDDAMNSFADAVDYLSDRFRTIIFKWNTTTEGLAASFGENMGKFVAGLGAAIDPLVKLAGFKRPADDAVNAFSDAVDYLSSRFISVMFKWNTSTEALAASFGDGVGKLLSGIGAAIDPLIKLSGFKKPSDEAIANFIAAVDSLSEAFKQIMFKWNTTTEGLAASFGEGIGKLIAGVGAAIDPLMKLADFKAPSQAALDAFFGSLSDFLRMFDAKAAQFQSQAGVVASELAVRIGTIVGAIGQAIDPLIKLQDFKHIDASVIESFFSNVWDALNQMGVVVKGFPPGFLDQAAAWGTKVSAAFGGLKTAMDTLAAIGGGSAGDGGGSAGSGVAGVLGAVLTGLKALMDYVNDTAIGVINSFKTAADGWNTAWDGMATTVENDVQRIIDAYNRLPTGNNTNNNNSNNDNPPLHIPGFATGGIVMSPTLAMIGEREPEAVVPLSQLGSRGNYGTGNITLLLEIDGIRMSGEEASRQLGLRTRLTRVAT